MFFRYLNQTMGRPSLKGQIENCTFAKAMILSQPAVEGVLREQQSVRIACECCTCMQSDSYSTIPYRLLS